MIKLLGKTVCFLLRRHKFRRLRKKELPLLAGMDKGNYRICDRCLTLREIKPRKKAEV